MFSCVVYTFTRAGDELLCTTSRAPFAVPEPVISRLRARTDAQLRRLEATVAEEEHLLDDMSMDSDGDNSREDGAGADADADLDENGDVDWPVILSRLNIAQRRNSNSSTLNEVSSVTKNTFSWCPLICTARSARARNVPLKVKKTSHRHFCTLFMRFAFPLLCLICFFAAIYATSVAAASKASDLMDITVVAGFLSSEANELVNVVSAVRRDGSGTAANNDTPPLA